MRINKGIFSILTMMKHSDNFSFFYWCLFFLSKSAGFRHILTTPGSIQSCMLVRILMSVFRIFFWSTKAQCQVQVSNSTLLEGIKAERQVKTSRSAHFSYIINCQHCSLISVSEMPSQAFEAIHSTPVPWTALTMVQ